MRLGALVAVFVLALAGVAGAAVEEKYYQQYRDEALVAFAGTVLRDSGGEARVQDDAVERGGLQVGAEVVVAYPEYKKGREMPTGAAVYYERFRPGDQLKVWGKGADPVVIVPKGIDLVSRGPKPAPLSGLAWWVGAAVAAALVALAAGGLVWRRPRPHTRSH
jgi:hypothetical protein